MYPVILSICGKQYYEDQEPNVIELVTEGILNPIADGWEIRYEESDLTGLEGVTTVFRVQPDVINLIRTGGLRSRMEFQTGVIHESLYETEFGAMMIAVCAQRIESHLTGDGGTVDLVYGIDIEQSAGGLVEYHLDVKRK